MKYQIMLLSILLLLTTGFLSAQNSPYISGLNHSVSTTDNFMAPLVNPAGLGYGNAQGIGWMHLYEHEKFRDHYWLVLNMQGLSYIYEKNEILVGNKWRDQSVHTLATGSETFTAFKFPNLYTGLSYQWKNDDFNEGSFKSGVLYRPLNVASIGFTWDNPYKDSPAYQFGLGLRPLALIDKKLAPKVEFCADLKYAKQDGDYKSFKPTLGINTQIINGIMLNANYDMESETSMLSIALGAKSSMTGTDYHNDGDNSYELDYIFAGEKDFLPACNKSNRKWYTPSISQNVVTYKAPSFEIGPFQIFDNKQTSVEELLKSIAKAKTDPAVAGLLFENKNFAASLALKQELINAIKDFKTTGKPVIFYYDNMSNGDCIFASAVADKIYLNPMGSVDLKGIAVNSPYLKGTLNALGIDIYNFRSHKTKTAGNMLSEDEMIPEERAMYESLIGDLYNQMCSLMETGRGSKLTKDIRTTIDEGPYYLADNALQAGLVDGLIYESQLMDTLKQDYKVKCKSSQLADYLTTDWAHAKKSKIAVIYAQGNIVMGKGVAGKIIAEETTVDIIRKVRKNPEYKGIILRIDSGGGSAQASDIIWHEIELAKSENKKPVVVTMAGVAGSGGYYIACNANHIIADPATITGSIGVIGLTFNMDRLFKKIKVNWGTVKMGRHSDFGTINRPWTDEEKEIFTGLIARSYHDFVSKVAKGRQMDFEAVDAIAQGKVWTGVQGKELGLVDELGGMKEAVAKVKELAKITNDIELVNASLSEKFGVGMEMQPMMSMLPFSAVIREAGDYLSLYDRWLQYKSEKVLFTSPYDLEAIANQ
jgi:protease-4